jgi:hypothetical protein
MALLNPVTNECEVGSMPSPSYETQPTNRGEGNDTVPISSDSAVDKTTNTFNDYFIKLFEFEQLTLNPGDMYGIAYQVTSGIDPIKSKNIYNVELYAVDKDNKQHKIEDPTFLNKVAVGNEDYVYMDKAVSAVLGLKVSLQEIDWFESVIYEKNKDIILKLNWANKLQDASTTADDIYIKGVRMRSDGKADWFLNASDTTSEKIKETLTINQTSYPELYNLYYKEGETLELELTPYDQFHYIDSLTRKLTITLGKDYEYKSENDVYKYKYSKSNKSLRIDFTMNTINMVDPYLYVEFYDVWSDYSVIMPIEDINPAGTNTLFIDTVNEPVEDDFTNSRGGVDPDLLTTWSADKELTVKNIYRPLLSDTIRIKQILRENNLYLVRIAAIDKDKDDLGSLPTANMYTTTYKMLIINENYNSWYDKLNDIGKTTGIDFNNENYNNTYSFDFDTSLAGGTEDETKTIDNKLTCKTGDYYYSYNKSTKKTFSTQSYTDKISKKGRYVLNTDIKSSSLPFGYLSKISTGIDTVDSSKTYITDTDTDVASEFKVEKIVGVENTEGIDITLYTERYINANINEEQKDNKVETTTPYELRTMWSPTDATVYPTIYGWRYPGQYYVQYLGRYKAANEASYTSKDPDYKYLIGGDCPNGDNLLKVMNKELTGSNYQYFLGEEVDAFSIDLDKKTNWGNIETKLQFESNSDTVWSGEPWALMLRTSANGAVMVKFDNTSEVIRALADIRAVPVEEVTYYLYTYDEVVSSATSTTELVGSVKLDLKSTAEIMQKVNYKNFFSKTDLKAALEAKISAAEGSAISLNNNYFDLNANGVRVNTSITLNIPDISITAAADKTVYNNLLKSSTDIKKQQPELFISSEHEDMVPYSESGEYSNQAKRFTCKLVNGKCRFTYKPNNLAKTKWNVPKNGDEQGPYVDKTLFDQL